MLCYRDTTFCGSPNCTNECGRKLTDEDKRLAAKLPFGIAFSMFCDQVSEEEFHNHIKKETCDAASE